MNGCAKVADIAGGFSVIAISDPAEKSRHLDALAELRIAVFREWPYLYDGDPAYERDYLREFNAEAGSVLVLASDDGGVIVGAATASPMASQKAEFQAPFRDRGMAVETLFYFGESVLLPQARGSGIGHGFFDAREAAARAAGATAATFCAVVRPNNHPLRPAGARDLHPFWHKRGYAPVEGLTTGFAWKDIDQPQETDHPMQFWLREF